MRQYLDLLRHIKENGAIKSDRTGVGTKSVFGYQMRFDLNKGFPLMTTKKVHLKSILYELLWFISGDTNISPFVFLLSTIRKSEKWLTELENSRERLDQVAM